MNIQVGDMVIIPGRFWRVTGIHIGGVEHENVVELQIVDRKPAQYGVKDVNKLLVPEALIKPPMIYRNVNALASDENETLDTPLE